MEREIYIKKNIAKSSARILLKFLSSGSSCSTLLLPSHRNILTLLFGEILAYFASVKLDLNTCALVKVIVLTGHLLIFNAL